MLRFWLEYIAEHIDTDEEGKSKAIIQLRPDLAQCLLQEDKEILTFEEEKKEIEKLIKKVLGKKWKFIEIQNVADNYPDVFNAIKNWRRWIIPSKEPKLQDLKLPLKSPLPIIKFLAYHAKNDPKLMDVFYKTKPVKYIWQDKLNDHIPWSSDADYYSVVEVWIRLFEVLNWISIQWGIGRQRVYDKIIGLILFGKDKIWKAKDYDINSVLKLDDYPALKNLHTRLVNSWVYSDVKMNQLYIELDEWSLGKIEKKVDKKQKYKTKTILSGAWLALLGALTFCGGKAISIKKDQINRDKEEQERIEMRQNYHTVNGYERHGLDFMEYLMGVEEEESLILEAAYDISEYDYRDDYYRDLSQRIGSTKNKIVEDFRSMFMPCYELNWKMLTAEDYVKLFWWKLIDQYWFCYQKPYEHLKINKWEAIANTLKYWEKIKLSESITKPSRENKVYKYYNIGEAGGRHYETYGHDHLYILKFVKVLIDGEYKELILAAKYDRYDEQLKEEFTLENWLKCMQDLQQNFWLEVSAN